MDVTPARPFIASSTLLPLAARSASVFFTTRYLAPAPRTALRSSKSFSTVSLVKVPTTAWLAPSSSFVSFSTCSIFFALVTAIFDSSILSSRATPRFAAESRDLHLAPEGLALRRQFHRRGVNRNTRSHGGTQIAALDVLALRNRRLRLDHAGNDRRRI